MLNVGKLRPGGATYYVGEIATSAEDYYLGRGEAPGRWVGSLAAEMGLNGEVEPEHFRALLEGRHPLTGEQLVSSPHARTRTASVRPEDEWLSAREAADQLGVSATFVRRLLRKGTVEGEKGRCATSGRELWRVRRADVNEYAKDHKPPKRRPGFDLTLRPPKSVSVLWALADPERRAAIRQAHREAVDEVVRYYERQAIAARHRGQRIDTAGLVAAAFDHRTSRAGDPLLHTHVVTANVTFTVNDAWRCLDARPLFDHAISGGYLYQAHLRHLLTSRTGIEWGPVVEGTADIVGVPQAVIDEFSQRRDEIEEMLAESGYTSARARQKATLATRQAKDRTVDPDTLASAWRDRAAALGLDDRAVEACFGRTRTAQREPGAQQLFALLSGPHGLTERASTFTRRDVVRAVAAAAGASVPAIEVERLADRFLASDHVVVLAGPTSGRNSQIVLGLDGRRIRTGGTAVFSTPELVMIETGLLARATQSAGPVADHRAIDRVLAGRSDLSREQAEMVRAVCGSDRAIKAIVGTPGSGKTYATAACVAAFAACGIPVAGCAVSAVAAAELESSVRFAAYTRRPAQTIAGLLVDLEQRGDRFAPETILLIDEASMIGTRDLARLLVHVERAEGSIVLIGDPDQHTAVDTGGVFKALAVRDGGTVARLVENRRQRDTGERVAIAQYRIGDVAAALGHYDGAGKVTRGRTAASTYDALVRDWWDDRRTGSTAPMLAGTNAARRALNARARALLKEHGVLRGEPLVVEGRELMVGDEVVARRNDRSLRANGRRDHVKNGSTGRVIDIDHHRGEVGVDFADEGRIQIPREYLTAGHLEHGYARTTYGVQGATLDRARYHASDASRFEEGYVAITRASDSTHVYVVEGDVGIDDEHHAIEPATTGLAAIVDSLGRRSNDNLAIAGDPLALDVDQLARTNTLQQLHERRRQIDVVLAEQPPSVVRDLGDARRTLAALHARHETLVAERPGWKPSRRREATRTLVSLEGAIDHAEHRVRDLVAQQTKHDEFATEHRPEFEERDLLAQAISARRLKITLEAVTDPPPAVVEVLGPRPELQRGRLRWDHAVEALVIYADETGPSLPRSATATADLVGPFPADRLSRLRHERVLAALHRVHAPDPDLGRSLGIG